MPDRAGVRRSARTESVAAMPVAAVPVLAVLVVAVLVMVAAGCASGTAPTADQATGPTTASTAPPADEAAAVPTDVYAHTRAGMVNPRWRRFPERVYVPNSESGTVDVIDPRTYRIIRSFPVGAQPNHVVPAWDGMRLWVNNTDGYSLTPIDPRTGRPGRPVPVADPYNLYFTPDGGTALVMAEALHRIDLRDPKTMARTGSIRVPCAGVNHADFTADGGTLVASCEFSGHLLRVDLARRRVTGVIRLHRPGVMPMPQDVRLAPDGRLFYVADMAAGGVWLVDAHRFRLVAFRRTGAGAHGIYPSRDGSLGYISNRGAGTITVWDFARRRAVRTWRLPGGGSPDMGGVSADGRVLWLSGRYHGEVYAIDTRTGRLIRRIGVGAGPHGLAVFPQPGRYSLGHTGNFR